MKVNRSVGDATILTRSTTLPNDVIQIKSKYGLICVMVGGT